MIELGPNRYGKSAIRLVKVTRVGERHSVRDLTVAVSLEGDFESAHVEGDNSLVVATDTMKNTVYAFAGEYLTGAVERFGLVLARHFFAFAQVSRATISIEEHGWSRLAAPGGGEAPDAFVRTGSFTRTASVAASDEGVTIEAGIRDLTLMKTTKSAFSGFPRDRYTTLPETEERLLATKATASWRYGRDAEGIDHDGLFEAVSGTLLEVFAEHHSPSVQASIWIIGRAILDRHAEVDEVRLVLPNLHHWLVDLSPFGLVNEGKIFVATEQPYGLIDAVVRRE